MGSSTVQGTSEPTVDVEKTAAVNVSQASQASATSNEQSHNVFQRWNTRVENLAGFEARGLERVSPEERQTPSSMAMLQMLLLWFSANITINNLAVALTGPLFFGLGFSDCAWCVILGVFFGSLTTGYMSTWGAVSGNRTMVVVRFFMGYYTSKITTLLNIILMVGYCTIDCIIGGQVLSAVSGGSMSIAVGIVIVFLIMTILAGFGLKMFHIYERYAWLPQVIVLFVLVGSAGPYFNASLGNTVTGTSLAASRLSFFSLMFYIPNSWAGAASDYYVLYPVDTPKWKIFSLTSAGLALSFWFVDLLGVGLACGVASNQAWSEAYEISSGALITAGYAPLGGFGKFCAVIVALGVIANAVPGTYSGALGCQIMGRYGEMIPRWAWVVILSVIQLVCGLAGRNHLFTIFTNFLALMSYWLMYMICIIAEEHLIFRRGREIAWSEWANPKVMPVGFASLLAFILGWVGAILGMYQTYYEGVLAHASGGADIGLWLGVGFTLLAYPPLRWLELKKWDR